MQNYDMQKLNTLPLLLSSLISLSKSRRPVANLRQKLVPRLGFDGEVDWRVTADERVKGGLIVEEIQKA
jgi:hypothetical protein